MVDVRADDHFTQPVVFRFGRLRIKHQFQFLARPKSAGIKMFGKRLYGQMRLTVFEALAGQQRNQCIALPHFHRFGKPGRR